MISAFFSAQYLNSMKLKSISSVVQKSSRALTTKFWQSPRGGELRLLLDSSVTIPPEHRTRFFKCKKGEYGYGDKFLGVTNPDLRLMAKKFSDLDEEQIECLISSQYNEERLLALLIMQQQFNKGSKDIRKKIYDSYIRNVQWINNWNLVDCSASYIVGAFWYDYMKENNTTTSSDYRVDYLEQLAKSSVLWERRIAIVSTWHFIRNGVLEPTFAVADILLGDEHDLIHKAVGWMLREAGKKDINALLSYLEKNSPRMPRTMLRYAIERLNPTQKAHISARG
jgi:3-methyladenine DNA glycosylase AlkD